MEPNNCRQESSQKRVNASAERNKDPLLSALSSTLKNSTPLRALEIASGTGTHVAHFAPHLPHVTWQPSDRDQENIPSLRAYREEHKLLNVLEPKVIDVSKCVDTWWDGDMFDLVLCINMIHISPWAATQGLMATAAKVLNIGGVLVTYGPYAVNGVLEPESNVNFNQSLQALNPEWGIRDLTDVAREAATQGLEMVNVMEMPANNKTVVFKKMEKSLY